MFVCSVSYRRWISYIDTYELKFPPSNFADFYHIYTCITTFPPQEHHVPYLATSKSWFLLWNTECVLYLIPPRVLTVDPSPNAPHPPTLLSTDVLVAKKSEEQASAVFTKMPSPYYMEIATLLLNRWISYIYILTQGFFQDLGHGGEGGGQNSSM